MAAISRAQGAGGTARAKKRLESIASRLRFISLALDCLPCTQIADIRKAVLLVFFHLIHELQVEAAERATVEAQFSALAAQSVPDPA